MNHPKTILNLKSQRKTHEGIQSARVRHVSRKFPIKLLEQQMHLFSLRGIFNALWCNHKMQDVRIDR
jgi:hypothetical protein